jgi:hypothetical protein
MRFVILQQEHFLGTIGRWGFLVKLNPSEGYCHFSDAEAQVDMIKRRPHHLKSLESVRPNFWIVPFGHPMHRSALRFQYGKELEGNEGLPWTVCEEGLIA